MKCFLLFGFLFLHSLLGQQSTEQILLGIKKDFEKKKWEHGFTDLQKLLLLYSGGDFTPLKTFPKTTASEVVSEVIAEYPYTITHLRESIEDLRPEFPLLQQGTHQHLEEMLVQLEDEPLKYYQSIVQNSVGEVEEAIAQQNLQYLAKIARAYLFSEEGPKATKALIEFCIERGEFNVALFYLRRLLVYRSEVVFEELASLICQMAFCYFQLENETGLIQCEKWLNDVSKTHEILNAIQENPAESLLTPSLLRLHYFRIFQNEISPFEKTFGLESRKTQPLKPVTIAEKSISPQKYIQSLLEKNTTIQEEWKTYGGNFQRNKLAEVDLPLLGKEKWSKPISQLPPVSHKQKNIRYNNPYQPIVVDGTIYINNGLGLKALDLFTGQEKWPEYRGFTEKTAMMEDEGRSPHLLLSATAEEDRIYLNVEREPNTKADIYNTGGMHSAQYNIQPTFPSRTIVCLDATKGNPIWVAQTENTPLQKANFSSAPLVYGDYLFCDANSYKGLVSSYLVCIDKHTGKIVYNILVGSAQYELNMFGRPVIEAVGSTLSIQDGIVYHCTNLGLLTAIEAYSGKVLWYLRYPQTQIVPPVGYETSYRRLHWYNNPILLHEDLLLFTPVDSPQIFAVNRWTGKVVWRRDREGPKHLKTPWNLRYLIGVAEDKVFLSGTYVVALDVKTGREIWSTREGNLYPYGRGILTSKYLYIPDQLYLLRFQLNGKSEIKNLRLKDQEKWKWPIRGGGNLFLVDGALVLMSYDEDGSNSKVFVFYDLEATQDFLEKRVQDPKATLNDSFKLASFYLRQGKSALAEEQYQKAKIIAHEKKDFKFQKRIRRALYSIYLSNAEKAELSQKQNEYKKALQEADSPEEEFAVYLKIIEWNQKKRESKEVIRLWEFVLKTYGNAFYTIEGENVKVAPFVLEQLAQYHIDQKQYSKAMACYQQLIEQYRQDEIQRQTGFDFATRRMFQMIERFGKECYAEQEKQAKELFERAKELNSQEGYLKLLDFYPCSELVESCRFALIQKQLEQKGNRQEVVLQLKKMIKEFPQSQFMPQILFSLFQIYYEEENFNQAKNLFRLLNSKYKDQEVSWQGKTFKIEDWLKTFQEDRLSRITPPNPEPDLVLSENISEYTWSRSFSPDISVLMVPEGVPPKGMSSHFYYFYGTTLYCFNAHQRDLIWGTRVNFELKKLFYTEKALLLLGQEKIVALAFDGKTELWSTNIPFPAQDMVVRNGIIASVYSPKGRIYLSICDMNTGQFLEKPIEVCSSQFGAKVYILQDFLVVSTRGPVKHYVYDLVTFALVSVIEGRNFHPLSNLILTEPNGLVFQDKEIVGQEEISVVKAYDLGQISKEAKPTWMNTKFSKIEPYSLNGKGNLLSLFQSVGEKKQLVVLDANTGSVYWQYPELLFGVFGVLLNWDYIYFSNLEAQDNKTFKQKITSLEAKNGNVTWKSSQLPGNLSSNQISFYNTKQYLCALIEEQDGLRRRDNPTFILIFDKKTGKLLRRYELKGSGEAQIAIVENTLIVVKNSRIYSYSAE